MSLSEPVRRERADVVVVGGGPAGSAAALRLARQGRHVVQLERRRFGGPGADRWRSGEGILPATQMALRRLGLTAADGGWAGQPAHRVKIRWPAGDVTVDHFSHGRCILALDREAFDRALWQRAAGAGADGREGWRVERLVLDGATVTGVQARAPDGALVEIAARLVVDAGGRNAPSIAQLDLRRPEIGDDFVAVVLFFDNVPAFDADAWEMHFFDPDAPKVMQGARLTGTVVRFALGTYLRYKQGRRLTPEAFFWSEAQAYPALEARLRAGTPVAPPYARARLAYGTASLSRAGLLLIGDAAGYLNPILGDGILAALRSAELAAAVAARAFSRGEFSRDVLGVYERRWRRERALHRAIGHLLIAGFGRPSLVDRIGHHTWLRRSLLGMLLRPDAGRPGSGDGGGRGIATHR